MQSSLLGQLLRGASGQPFVVENKAGAGGLIAASAVARAEPDGCTLLITMTSPIRRHLRSSRTSLKKRVDIVRVAYRSNPPAVTDLMTGHIATMIPDFNAGQVRERTIRPIAVFTRRATAGYWTFPTLAETMTPRFDILAWAGMFAPANTPRNVIDRLADTLRKVLVDPTNVERFADIGTDTFYSGPQIFSDYVKTEPVKWTSVAKEAPIEPK
jgi:tripartite-type tricarboxylate transporter receptor subunit TctC